MNGFADRGLDEGQFDEPHGLAVVKAFDAFPKTKRSYLTETRYGGGFFTIFLIIFCIFLTYTEIYRWFVGQTTHTFTVEKGIGHEMQINLDIIVAMKCSDLHVNVQDALGDRILAGDMLSKDDTKWFYWTPHERIRRDARNPLQVKFEESLEQYQHEDDVHDYLAAARKSKKFAKTPRLRGQSDACRIYGVLEGNKVQGDFHITARGHGYIGEGGHLDHSAFNFSHHINELSFGPHIPSLHNPLDDSHTITDMHFYKYQYYLSVVPTIYTTDIAGLDNLESTAPPSLDDPRHHDNQILNPLMAFERTIYTNQYAATDQSHQVGEAQAPGIFIKYDIEPILMVVAEEWGGILGLFIRCVNVISGILVAGGWLVSMLEWAQEVWGRRRRRTSSMMGMLHGNQRLKSAMD